MKKIVSILFILFVLHAHAQVTQIWTDFGQFWTSSSTSQNPVWPNLPHNLLAFRFNGTNYSTGVNNTRLTQNGVTFVNTKFRALPISEVPLTGGTSYFIGIGALEDGNQTVLVPGFVSATTSFEKARFLTRGVQGLDLGSCLTNIPTGSSINFNLSSNGITIANVGDGVPDILVSQVAQAEASTDRLRFVNASGVTVGNEVTISLNNNTLFPIVGRWNMDFRNNDGSAGIANTDREMRFFAVDLSAFGINASNYQQAVRLVYVPGGNSDPAFIAFNEPSLGIARRLLVTAQPTTSNCAGVMPSPISVQLVDAFDDPVQQAGYVITASMGSGPGALLGTLTATTNANGVATFNNLIFEVGGDHTIRFSNTSLDDGLTANIAGEICADNVWTGNANTSWHNTGNWQTAFIPNANNNVTIPAGRPNYPVLTADAGAKDLIMGENTSINLNGRLFAVSGNISATSTSKIAGSVANSVLYFSGTSPQTIPNGLVLNGLLSNLTVENAAGVSNNDVLFINQVLRVVTGSLNTGNNITLTCSFSPRRTGQIGQLLGSATITGNVRTEQCFPARRAFRFISPSVTTTSSIRANWQEGASAWNYNPNPGYGTHITGVGAQGPESADGTNGFDWQPSGNPSMFTFNAGTQQWTAVTSTLGTLTAGTPYRIFIRGSRSTNLQSNGATPSNTILRSTGTVAKGPVTFSGLPSTNGNFVLLGNPFQSIVDLNAVKSTAVNLKPVFYVWDPTLGGNPIVGQSGGRGAYVSVNAFTGVKNNVSSAASLFLQPYQAFFAEVNNLGVPASITFNEADKRTSQSHTNVFRTQMLNALIDEGDVSFNAQFISVQLFNQHSFDANSTSSDGFRIDFYSAGNNEFDENDGLKFGNSDENISRRIGTQLSSLESRALPEVNEVLPIELTQYRTTDYVLQIESSSFYNLQPYLHDAFTNQQAIIALGSITNYSFSVSDATPESKNADRFSIVFESAPLSNEDFGYVEQIKLYPNPAAGETIYINSQRLEGSSQVSVTNLLGQEVMRMDVTFSENHQIALPIEKLISGVYVVSVKLATGEYFSSKFIRK